MHTAVTPFADAYSLLPSHGNSAKVADGSRQHSPVEQSARHYLLGQGACGVLRDEKPTGRARETHVYARYA
jgi:hypothetical protein